MVSTHTVKRQEGRIKNCFSHLLLIAIQKSQRFYLSSSYILLEFPPPCMPKVNQNAKQKTAVLYTKASSPSFCEHAPMINMCGYKMYIK